MSKSKKHKWISVDRKLPADNHIVIINAWKYVNGACSNRVTAGFRNGESWIDVIRSRDVLTDGEIVTHWKKWPKSPWKDYGEIII